MAYGSNLLGQENSGSYPYPKWHPYYGWGYPAQQPQAMIGDPNIRPGGYPPPGNWFGRPVVGALAKSPDNVRAVQVGSGLLVGGAAYLATKSLLSAVLGGAGAALLVTLLPIWEDAPPAFVPRGVGLNVAPFDPSTRPHACPPGQHWDPNYHGQGKGGCHSGPDSSPFFPGSGR